MNYKIHAFVLLLIGSMTGLLSYHLVWNQIPDKHAIEYIPGIIFGFVIGIYFCFFQNFKNLIKLPLFILASTIGYFLAYFVTVQAMFIMPFNFFVSGVLGSSILLW